MAGLVVAPSSLRGLVETDFLPDEHGGSGTRILRCEACGKSMAVSEDMGGHVPQYQWPGTCLGGEAPTAP